ncbi:hypothetical protein CU097_008187 [Rhizopus azygosporus]|nr:hypothetical protein CU097_008187 [Rhizopus azygosporus]
MTELGKRLLKEEGFNPEDETQIRLGFHVPPFNSVNHLHMHVIGLPFKNKFRYLKYKVGLPWFMDINALFMSLKSEL